MPPGVTAIGRSVPGFTSCQPRAISTSLIDSLLDDFSGGVAEERGLAKAKVASRARDALYIPAHHPAVSSMIVGRDGSI